MRRILPASRPSSCGAQAIDGSGKRWTSVPAWKLTFDGSQGERQEGPNLGYLRPQNQRTPANRRGLDGHRPRPAMNSAHRFGHLAKCPFASRHGFLPVFGAACQSTTAGKIPGRWCLVGSFAFVIAAMSQGSCLNTITTRCDRRRRNTVGMLHGRLRALAAMSGNAKAQTAKATLRRACGSHRQARSVRNGAAAGLSRCS